jgi:dihydroflavonol-4-reductase
MADCQMRAFVTGATGFIGRRLVERLTEAGAEVTALVRRQAQELPVATGIVQASLEDPVEKLAGAMTGHDVVYHLAARVSFDPGRLTELLRVNGEGTRRVLQAAGRAGVPRTVVVSSACTIGLSRRPDRVLDEGTPPDPWLEKRNPYLRSKRVAEGHAFDAARKGQWVTVVNPTTVFGPGDRSLNSGTLVRQVARAPVVLVPPGGSNVIDVDDTVEGIWAAALRGRSGRRYILGGVNLRFGEIIERIARVVGRNPLRIRLVSAARYPLAGAAWMMQHLTRSRLITPQIISDTFAFKYYSSRRAEAELGWRAHRDFTGTLGAAWDFYRREGLIGAPAGAVA